jgi:glycerophosphoryl diester phosphodiesterase
MTLLKTKDHNNNTITVAHRGASADAPENTIAAFKSAWQQGADVIEGDFQLTSDGQIVCIHDTDTLRVSGTRLVVKESTLAELRQLNMGWHFHDQSFDEKIPTIEQVFATIPNNKKILIEVKCGVEILPALIQQIQRSNLDLDQIGVIAFDQEVIKQCKLIEPKLIVLWLNDFNKINDIDFIVSTLLDIKADGLLSNDTVADQLRDAVKKQGLIYNLWVADDSDNPGK